jgi:NTE family protein
MITNLAFKGGGVKGIAFVGALRELEKADHLLNVKRVGGTSAGALVAAMYALEYNINEIEKLMQGLNFRSFEDHFNPLRLLTHYGLYEGDYILDFAHKLLLNSNKGLTADATFSDMRAAGFRDLYVFATNLNAHAVVEFSADKTPGAIVAEAIRASMSIPLFFKAWRFSNGIPDNHIYVDGGLLFNYPISFFDSSRFTSVVNMANPETIGLFLQSPVTDQSADELKFDTVLHYTRHLFETLLDSQDQDFIEDGVQLSRSVLIDDLGISATNFNLTAENMQALVNSGAKGAKDFIANYEKSIALQDSAIAGVAGIAVEVEKVKAFPSQS